MDLDTAVRRLEWEFDEEAPQVMTTHMVRREFEDGEEDEDNPKLDVVIVAHIESKNETGEFDCPICYESIHCSERVTISCRHDFCVGCMKDLLRTCNQEQKNVTCPMCRYSCFLLETPDKGQFAELSEFLDEIHETNEEIADRELMSSFLYYHFTHPMNNEENVYF